MNGHKKNCNCGTQVWVTTNQAGNTVELERSVITGYELSNLGAQAATIHREHKC